MCTLTIIPIHARGSESPGFRLVTNRDEQRTRPPATPPAHHAALGEAWVWPEDGLAGGTWVAASDRGLVLSILNLNLVPRPILPPRSELTSRGRIIPALAAANTADQAIDLLGIIPLAAFAPFRLVAADLDNIIVARWDRERLTTERQAPGPLCLVSSGLGDHVVAPRLELFDALLAEQGSSRQTQDLFHRHSWPGRAEISVLMSRADARTVSTTSVEVLRTLESTRVEMTYRADNAVAVASLPGRSTTHIDVPPRVAALGPARC